MKTYLLVWFSSEGANPSEIGRRLMSLGFEPVSGSYDYVFDWGNTVELDEIVKFGDKVHLSLKGMNVMFKIETINGKE